MINKFKILTLLLASWGAVSIAVAAPVYAETQSHVDACAGLTQLDPSQPCTATTAKVEGPVAKLITAVVNILTIIIGVASVIMIIIGGLKYVTSGGDSNAVSSAKSTVLYALIGLVVAVLAQFLVHFVVDKITTG